MQPIRESAPQRPESVPPVSESRRRVREEVLSQHRALTAMLDRVERALPDVEIRRVPDPGAVDRLRRATGELYAALASHLDYEDHHLLPIVRAVDPWGDSRATRIEHEHAQQRELLDWLMHELGSGIAPQALAEHVHDFAAGLSYDMRREEQEILHPDLLGSAARSAAPEPEAAGPSAARC